MISPQSIQEVLNRAEIVEVVEQFVRLKKRGANYVANCPFHNEKSPSFSVSASRGIFKCFGCGKGGNAITFVQEHEKLSYPEAIRWLANFYKIELEETQLSDEQQQQIKVEEHLRVINEFAAQFFQDQLNESEEGRIVGLPYFKQRGFRADIIEKFRLGYCPSSGQALSYAAAKKGYDLELLEKTGLVKRYQNQTYDSYKERVIFPIQSLTGGVIGFGARILRNNEKAPKYINTPENEIYHKSNVLYGLFQSRSAIAKADECLLVEGYTDVISLHQAGIEYVVASSGTALTEQQLRLIARNTKNLTILYDGDAAGIKAALRGMDLALAQSFNVQLVLLPEGNDPDSFVKEKGASEFQEYIKANKQDIISFRLKNGLANIQNDPIQKSKLVNEIAESISKINKVEDFALQDHYIKQAAEQLGIDEAGMVNLVNQFIRNRITAENKPRVTPVMEEEQILDVEQPKDWEPQSANERQEWQLIKVLIHYGAMPSKEMDTIAEEIFDRIDPEIIDHEMVKKLYHLYYNYHAQQGSFPDQKYFTQNPDPEIQTCCAKLLYQDQEISKNWLEVYGIGDLHDEANYYQDVESTLCYFELKKVKVLQQEVQAALKNASTMEQQEKVLLQYVELKKVEQEILAKQGTVILKS